MAKKKMMSKPKSSKGKPAAKKVAPKAPKSGRKKGY